MSSKYQKEGCLFVDHRDSPGLTDEMVAAAGLPPGYGHGRMEMPTFTCTHCERVVIMSPTRRRDRAYCSKCDRYICDDCGAAMAVSGVCKPFRQIVEEVQEAASKGLPIPIYGV